MCAIDFLATLVSADGGGGGGSIGGNAIIAGAGGGVSNLVNHVSSNYSNLTTVLDASLLALLLLSLQLYFL